MVTPAGRSALVDGQLVVGERQRGGRASPSSPMASPGSGCTPGLGLQTTRAKSRSARALPSGLSWRKATQATGRMLARAAELVELEHLVEGTLQESEVVVGEARAVRPAREVGVDVAVDAVEGVRDGELAAHRAVAALLLLGFFLGRHGAAGHGMLVADDGMQRAGQAELHRAAHLAAVDVGRHDGTEGADVEEVVAHPAR